MSILETSDILELAYHADAPVVVVPQDEVRFSAALDAIAAACGVLDDSTEFKSQVRELLTRMAEWLTGHQDQIHRAYLTTRKGGLLFVVEMKSPQYSRDLEDALTELDMLIARDPGLSLIRINVLAVPRCSPENEQLVQNNLSSLPAAVGRFIGGPLSL
jgi:hypothetical protein